MSPLLRLCAAAVLAAPLGSLSAPARAAGDSVVDRLTATGELTIGVRRDARPHSYLDDAGKPAGLTIEVCGAVVEELRRQLGLAEIRVRHEPVDATDRFQAVAEGRIDMLCGAATITLSRREIVDFSIPTFADGASVMTRAGASDDFAALDGKRVGVRAGTTTERALVGSLSRFGIKAELRPVADHAEGLRLLESGEIDAYFGDQSILYALWERSARREALVVSSNTLTLELHGLALPLSDHRFRLEIDRALSRLYQTGRMAEFFEAAFPGREPNAAIQFIHTFAPVPP